MKFELLSNEILIECFEYLNSLDIFYSFEQLNYRFYKLIQNTPLYLNFQHVRKSIFDQFCKKILLNPDIKKQIYSLQLSNEDTCGQIKAFLSLFSLNEFSHLQSLTLTEVGQDNVEKLSLMLPLIIQLSSFRLMKSESTAKEILTKIPISKLRTLSVTELRHDLKPIDQISLLSKLTLSYSYLDELCQVLKSTPMLKYLNCQNILKHNNCWNCLTDLGDYRSIHLKQLIMIEFKCNFEEFEMFIKHTPKLKSLTISAENKTRMIGTGRWEYLITSSLPQLTVFKFKFSSFDRNENTIILDTFRQFDSDFWQEHHHWNTEYGITLPLAFISTISSITNTYELTPNVKRYCQKFKNNFNPFDNVTDLTFNIAAITDYCHYHFSNVTSLTFTNLPTIPNNSEKDEISLQDPKFLQLFKQIINMSHLRHLNVIMIEPTEISSILLLIFKEAPQLTSMTIHTHSLVSLFTDDELCKYMNKMIRILDINSYTSHVLNNVDNMEQFCKIFSNIEELKCRFEESNSLLFLLSNLSKLSILHVYALSFDDSKRLESWLKDEAAKLEIIFHIKYNEINMKSVCIWLDRNMN